MLALRAQVLFVCLTVLLFGIARSYAQSSPAGAGTISGSILDVSGKPIPGAGVSIKNEASGSPRTVVADPEGKFSVSGLPAGTYTLEASAPSFASSRRTGVKLAASAAENVNLSLNVGEIAQSITVECRYG